MGIGAAGLANLVPTTQADKLGLSKMLADTQAHLLPDEAIKEKVAQHHETAMNIAAMSGNTPAAETILRTNFTKAWDANPTRVQKLFPGKTRQQAIQEYVGANSSEEDLGNPTIAQHMDPRNAAALARSGRKTQQTAYLKSVFAPQQEGVDSHVLGSLRNLASAFPSLTLVLTGLTEELKKQGRRIDQFGPMAIPGEAALSSRGTTEEAGGRTGEAPTLSETREGEVGGGEGQEPDKKE